MPKKLSHYEYEEILNNKEINYFPIETYITSRTPINHECLKGHVWKVAPGNILAGKGCPYCAGNKKHTQNSYISKLLDRNIWSYIPVTNYINIDTPIEHLCKICDNIWFVRPNDVLNGKGCPTCSTKGFKTSKEAVLYFISFIVKDIKYYKIGITNHSTEHRFGSEWDKHNMKLEWDILFTKGSDALKLEQKLKKENSNYSINTGALKNGNTETFSVYIDKPKIVLDKSP